MRAYFLLPALGLALAVPTLALAEAKDAPQINVVADEWPPFSGADLPGGGISLDVISAVLTRAGYKVKTEILPWARVMDGAKRNEHDVVGSLFFDPDLEPYLTYGEPFYTTKVRFVRKQGTDHSYADLESLEPYSIAVGEGFLYEDNFDAAENLNKVPVTTALQGVRMVAHGRADLTLDSIEVINHALTVDAPELADMVEFAPGVLAAHEIHMAVRNNMPEKDALIADFNRTLAEMRADGSLDALLEKHVGN